MTNDSTAEKAPACIPGEHGHYWHDEKSEARPMPSEYTPMTENVRLGYAYRERRSDGNKHHPGLLAEFDRWLAAHDEQVRADAAREAHNAAADVMTRRKIKPFDGLAVLAAIDGLATPAEQKEIRS